MVKEPKITVVTVVYNSVDSIEKTILSVINQTYNNVEYIVIDGGSNDGTFEIIQKYSDYIAFWSSEPDEGIYNAMNKSLIHATGEWIIFMNSGDTFASSTVIENVFSKTIYDKYALVYGDTIFSYGRYRKMEKLGCGVYHKYMPCCHQSIFCKTVYVKEFGFNEKYLIAADLDLFYKIYNVNSFQLYKDVVVSIFDAMTGISNTNKERRNIEFADIIYRGNLIKKVFNKARLRIKYSIRHCFYNKNINNESGYTVLYDNQIFTMQRYGGISRYFCELAKELKCNKKIMVRFSLNHYLCNYDICKDLVLMPHFIFRLFKNKLISADKERVCRKLRKLDGVIFHPTYYDPYFLDSIGTTPFVITVHDLVHEIYPTSFSDYKEVSNNKKNIIEKASHIIAISQNTKKDLIRFYHVDEKKIDVIYHGTNMVYVKRNDIKIDYKYILFVGDRSKYKNFDRLLRAFALLVKQDPGMKLVCTGRRFNSYDIKQIKELNLDNHVIQRSVNDRGLEELYQKALVFVYPSIYEGFGIPILEAWTNRTPIALSNTSCFPEIAGDAGIYFNPLDVNDMACKILSVINNESLRQSLVNKGIERLKMFSWENTAKRTQEVYDKVWQKQIDSHIV